MTMATTSSIIDNSSSLIKLIDTIDTLPTSPPSLYIDLEGISLSREGRISILQLFNHPKNHLYLVDIHVLGHEAFTTAAANGKSLRTILESPDVPKVFFDVRNDSNAFFFHFDIRLQGVEDIQLMENASRPGFLSRKRFVSGLARCVEHDAPISLSEKRLWKEHKERRVRLFNPDCGGSYETLNARPLPQAILDYGVCDLTFLPLLRTVYWSKLSPEWKALVDVATKERLRVSQTLTYQRQTRDKVLSPWQVPINENGRNSVLGGIDLFGA
ncbi:hypothetical protein PAAG_04553 [Paracoccidioides lutzii Pb01]|uniref:3'-5' exonuclease domain-containing protein n=1 Tax=Paracoccidioides lutzii (strain ATCC MYA-826 / Pb01) TaxID=502779 RepID=C1H1A9_PARBA|nr:hypothetical protein PAAG_04553 [Paracoccidioides lutzii Pb01]EEH33503.1 hypothetical protein PAAG_04553 [Paracoccidioides lutzii Pb01]